MRAIVDIINYLRLGSRSMPYVIVPRRERTQPIRIVPGYPQTPMRNPRQPLVRRPPTLSELTGPTAVARRVN